MENGFAACRIRPLDKGGTGDCCFARSPPPQAHAKATKSPVPPLSRGRRIDAAFTALSAKDRTTKTFVVKDHTAVYSSAGNKSVCATKVSVYDISSISELTSVLEFKV